jgi:hypothetical protein
MEHDFSKPYRGVQYFGVWADESADDYGKRDAMAVLCAAVACCYDEDARTAEVAAALAYLTNHGLKPTMARAFNQALDMPDSTARATCARATYSLMCRHLGHPDAAAEAQRMRRLRRLGANN